MSERWPSLRAAIRGCTDPWSSVRAAALAVEWLLACDAVPREIAREAVELARDAAVRGRSRDTFFAVQRLRSGLAMLALTVGDEDAPPDPHFVSAREIARGAAWFAGADQARPDLGVDGQRVTSTALDRIEGAHWGLVGDDLGDFWDSTGTPGVAWQRVASNFLSMRFGGAMEPRLTLHHIASLQLGADLRLGTLHRHARMAPEGAGVSELAAMAWQREHLLQRLEDLGRLQDDERPDDRPRASRFDAFSLSAETLIRAGAQSPWALTGWDVASTVFEGLRDPPAARTCAFLIERRLLALDEAVHGLWRQARDATTAAATRSPDAPEDAAQRVLQMFVPSRRITDLEAWLRGVPPMRVVLGVSIGAAGELLMSVVCQVDGGTLVQPLKLPNTLGWQALHALRELLQPRPDDSNPNRGADAARAQALEQLRSLLDEALGRCLAGVPRDRPLMLSVFAPGALRAMPWWALTAHGVPLRDRFVAVMHLPHLGFDGNPSAGDGSRVLCALGDERGVGETRFGACAIRTLRACFPNTVAAEPVDQSRGTDIVETERLEGVSARVEVVRWYGVGASATVNASTEGLCLSGHRTLSARNLFGTTLPRSRRVEYWAATGDMGSFISTFTNDREVYPSLVWSALAAGASGVLDLAWPVHDLVKALVCERFGIITGRRPEVLGAAALGTAVREVAALLARWRREAAGFESVRAALSWLDEARRVYAREAGLDPANVVAFAAHADAPSVAGDPDEITRRCASPVHLGAFRWWGL
ncbi:MAG: hypothetical protein HY903_22085 [Deltaproteobacteria bacterium]|nr:hypothetical protein [Deltaproteobacteria bacterium]